MDPEQHNITTVLEPILHDHQPTPKTEGETNEAKEGKRRRFIEKHKARRQRKKARKRLVESPREEAGAKEQEAEEEKGKETLLPLPHQSFKLKAPEILKWSSKKKKPQQDGSLQKSKGQKVKCQKQRQRQNEEQREET